MNKQQLAAKIWESANRMRSKIEANEYKDYILGFIFYKFLSDLELKFFKENGWTDEELPEATEEDEETVCDAQARLGYFIAYPNLFSTWIAKGADFSAGDVTDALNAFGRLISSSHKKVFSGIFATLETGLSKLGETSGARTRAIKDLIYLIDDIPMDDSRQDYDVLGFIYEYLIGNFAANAGKKAGEFYTPHEVSLLMSEIVAEHLKNRKEIQIFDPTSGSGSLLINIGKSVARRMGQGGNIRYFAQELKENTYNLTRMNLVMRGILPDNIVTRNGDTLEDDWPFFEDGDRENTYRPLYLDAVVSNPPYSQSWNPKDKEGDPRFARFGLAPKSKADYAFLLHDLYHLKPDGIMAIVLPHGVLFRGGEEGEIRKNLIEANHIDAIIGLPANIFFGTGIPTIIMILRQKRESTDVLMIDASRDFEKIGKNNALRSCDIRRIADTVALRRETPGYSRAASREEIRANEYNLNIPRYVDSSEKAEKWSIHSLMFGGIPDDELEEMAEYWQAFPRLKTSLFESKKGGYYLTTANVTEAVFAHDEVKAFLQRYERAFDGFAEGLYDALIARALEASPAREEAAAADSIFARLEGIPIVDKYAAYQQFYEKWQEISGDLEIIQTEGFDAVRRVDPKMASKKKGERDDEVQEGWEGRILPFELVERELLKDDLAALQEKERALAELSASLEELADILSEEEKEACMNEDRSAFVEAKAAKAIKEESAQTESLKALKKAIEAMAEAKRLKAEIRAGSSRLQIRTKEKIESLSREEAMELLRLKWIAPLCSKLLRLPLAALEGFAARIKTLAQKYSETFAQVESGIAEEEAAIGEMLGALRGGPDAQGIGEFSCQLTARN